MRSVGSISPDPDRKVYNGCLFRRDGSGEIIEGMIEMIPKAGLAVCPSQFDSQLSQLPGGTFDKELPEAHGILG
jgi:hypothetical protein